jgi:hypothetical protein
MIDAEDLDALAILSPAETHETFLDAALAAGLHALCEKPFVWGGPAPARSAARIADGFAARGLLLHEVCQWPYTLAAYEHLHPGALSKAPERFEMELQPAARGVDGVAQSLPHVLSLLQALSPGDAPRIENPTWSTTDPKADVLSIAFSYRTRDTTTRALVTLTPTDRHPRACAIAIDGRRAERRVSGEAYRLSFVADDGRSEPLGDPLARLVADFVRALSHPSDASASALRRRIVERMTLLDDLVTDYARLAGMA